MVEWRKKRKQRKSEEESENERATNQVKPRRREKEISLRLDKEEMEHSDVRVSRIFNEMEVHSYLRTGDQMEI